MSVLCVTDRERRRFDTIIVPNGTPGYRIMPPYGKMGLRSCDTRELSFEECRVPAINRSGSPNGGQGRVLRGFYAARILLASTALGLAQECLDIALAYAKERHAFGRPIIRYQYVQGMLVKVALNVELSRLIRDKAARLLAQGQPHGKEAAMAKWFCCESAKRAADYVVQIFGAMGFTDECAASRYYRDILAATIADGTTEIQKYIVAREMGFFA